MKHLLRHEAPALVITLISALLLAMGSSDWRFSFVPFPFLTWWLYLRLLRLEKWIADGMEPGQAPHDAGLVGEILRHLQRRERNYAKRKKRINRLLRRINRQIAALPDATLVLGPDLLIEWANGPAQSLLGIRYPADRGHPLGHLLRDEKLLRYLRTPRDKPLEMPAPVNREIHLRLRVIPIDKQRCLLIARNISKQKQMEQALKQFVAHASHELKTPLTTISGYLELLEAETRLSDNGRRALKVAIEQTQRMNRLILDLLQLSRLESRSLDPEQGEELPVAVLAEQLIGHLPSARRQRIHLDAEIGLKLRGLATEMESILQNLLDNALAYTEGEIWISWRQNGEGEAVLEVADQGPGIDSAELEAIRRRYYRGRDTTARGLPGSGLGLSIVEQAARLHDGRLEIDSSPERGSRFRVYFPAWRTAGDKKVDKRIIKL